MLQRDEVFLASPGRAANTTEVGLFTQLAIDQSEHEMAAMVRAKELGDEAFIEQAPLLAETAVTAETVVGEAQPRLVFTPPAVHRWAWGQIKARYGHTAPSPHLPEPGLNIGGKCFTPSCPYWGKKVWSHHKFYPKEEAIDRQKYVFEVGAEMLYSHCPGCRVMIRRNYQNNSLTIGLFKFQWLFFGVAEIAGDISGGKVHAQGETSFPKFLTPSPNECITSLTMLVFPLGFREEPPLSSPEPIRLPSKVTEI